MSDDIKEELRDLMASPLMDRVQEVMREFLNQDEKITLKEIAEKVEYKGDLKIFRALVKSALLLEKAHIRVKNSLITKNLIFEIANKMQAEGNTPTTRKIKDELGHGGNDTISKYLKLWKGQTGNSITAISRLDKDEVFKVLDGMKQSGEKIGVKPLGRKIGSQSWKTLKKMITEWES